MEVVNFRSGDSFDILDIHFIGMLFEILKQLILFREIIESSDMVFQMFFKFVDKREFTFLEGLTFISGKLFYGMFGNHFLEGIFFRRDIVYEIESFV